MKVNVVTSANRRQYLDEIEAMHRHRYRLFVDLMGWRALQSEPSACDLLITDLTMPGMTGVDLARKVSALRPNLPIILTSGFSGALTLSTLQEFGIREIIHKPLNYGTIGLTLQRVLNTQAAEQPSDPQI